MSKLEPRIEAVRAKYDLSVDDFWQIPQNKQWVCKHAALEVVAVKAGIEWLPPQIIEADAPNLVTSMIVTGQLGNRVEWATGETNSTNYSVKGKQPAYPWAMSEKRAKDRVVLKLVGIHGLVYSEDELATPQDEPRTTDQRSESGRREVAKTSAQEPKQSQPKTNTHSKEDSRQTFADMVKAIRGFQRLEQLQEFWETWQDEIKLMPKDWLEDLNSEKNAKKREFQTVSAGPVDAKEYIAENFPGAPEMKGN